MKKIILLAVFAAIVTVIFFSFKNSANQKSVGNQNINETEDEAALRKFRKKIKELDAKEINRLKDEAVKRFSDQNDNKKDFPTQTLVTEEMPNNTSQTNQ